MSANITTAFVQQYSASAYFLLQQKGSKLRPYVRMETISGDKAFFDQIGSVNASVKTGRHQPTPYNDAPHARRRVTTQTYHHALFLDPKDDIRILIAPQAMYAEAQAMALGRAIDDVIIAAIDATAYTGVDGSTSTSYDSSMTIGIQTVWPGVTPADTGMNLAKLIEIRKTLGSKNVDPDEEVFLAIDSRQISSLLKDERVVSRDYNAAMPLMSGQVTRLAGVTLVPCERLTTDGNGDYKLPYWTRSGMLMAMGQDIQTKITERSDLSYSTQVYSSADFGATRMEEYRVGYVLCDPGASPTTDA